MAISQRIREYLDSQQVNYSWVSHPHACAAQEVAHTLHVSGKRFAKVVVLHANGHLVMVVLPASHRVNMHELKDELAVERLEIASESELGALCSDCELGALPPFGKLYGMDVWVDRLLTGF